MVRHECFSVKLTSKQHIQKKKWDFDKEQTQQVKTAWTQEVNEVNTNYMQQDNTRVKEWTKHVGVMTEIIRLLSEI